MKNDKSLTSLIVPVQKHILKYGVQKFVDVRTESSEKVMEWLDI